MALDGQDFLHPYFYALFLRYIKAMKKRMTRRLFLGSALGAGAMALLPRLAIAEDLVTFNFLKKKGTDFPYRLTDRQWRDKLGPEGYEVMRLNKNETSGTSPLLRERRKGTYLCRGCGQPLFSSSAKMMASDYPTFRQPLNLKVIRTARDFGIILPRTEVHCANCGGHLGFKMLIDGEGAETWRYPVNGSSLTFQPA
jgi:peptide-methionine (R)-S-oxide reductase